MTKKISRIYCVTGIDTDIGKTVVTGLLAKSLIENGVDTVTQKFVQTGCAGTSEDILAHREIMGLELLDVDRTGITCPYVFRVPCSPHLAAKLENSVIDCEKIHHATEILMKKYSTVLLEGAGGLLVPITENFTFLDYLEQHKYPLILVTSPRLGSINHTLAALELAYHRGVEIAGIVYNHYGETDRRIVEDSRNIFQLYLQKFGFSVKIADVFEVDDYGPDVQLPDLYSQLFA